MKGSGSVISEQWRVVIAMCLWASLSSCGHAPDAPPPPPARVLTSVSVTLPVGSIPVGQTTTASSQGFDQNGGSIDVGPVVWSTGSAAIATVNANGSVMGVAPGQTQIIATAAGGKTGQATLVVTPIPVASVGITPAAPTIVVGAVEQLTATTLDANGGLLTGRAVTWETSDPTRVTVGPTGLAAAVAAGTATVTATSEGQTGFTIVTVIPRPVASVTVAPPSVSLPIGGTQQLTATTSDATGSALSGRLVTWTTSDATKATVSASGLVTGVAVGSASIIATSEGKSGSSTVTVTASAATVTLATPGQSISFLNSPNFNESLALQPGSQYLIAVVNTDPFSSLREDFTLLGSGPATTAASASASRAASLGRARVEFHPSSGVHGQALQTLAAIGPSERTHAAILEENRQIFARFGNLRAAQRRGESNGLMRRESAAVIVPTIGAVNRVYVKNALSGSCAAVDSIGARTVAVGQHVIVLADTNSITWPQAFRPDSAFYQTFADEYDQITWPHLLANIGNPLGYDASLSRLGKVTVTLTPLLNNFAGGVGGGAVVAFVNGCDFLPFAATGPNAAFSNQTEMFYSWVPAANGFDVFTWQKALRATAAHESKHIVSYTDRILNNSAVFEEAWLEEGLAQVSSEIWQRNFNQATWKGHANFLQTAACEINLGDSAPCDLRNNKPYNLLASHLPFFFVYLQNEAGRNSEGLGLDTPANYGAAWAFARWATDQYATSGEGTFIKSLINEPTLSGLPNLSSHAAQPVPLLLVYWNVAAALFQTPAYTAADVRTTTPSFNFADIFKVGQSLICDTGPCGLFVRSGNPLFPVQPTEVSAGPFSMTVVGVRGTAASYFLLSASVAGNETLQLLNLSGGPLASSSGFRVAILRVK